MRFIGLDLGSTTIKTGVLNLAAEAVSNVRSRPFPAPIEGLPADHFEIDPETVVAATGELLAETLAECGACTGVVVTSQMGGVVLADAAGRAASNYLSWRDQRSLEPHPVAGRSYFDELQTRTTDADRDAIGRELKPGSTASVLFCLAEKRTLPEGAATAMGLGEYVIARLCGAPPRSEPTSALGLIDLAARTWHRDWFERLGFGRLGWPQLAEFHEPAGEITFDGQRIPCYPAIGDQQAALAGADLAAGELSLNISTGSQVALLDSAVTHGDYQTRPYFDGTYLNTITHLPAGRALNALVGLLCELPRVEGHSVRDPWRAIAAAVERTPATELEVSLAFFASAVGDRGHVSNIRLEDLTVGSLFRAAFEHMADNCLRCALRLSPERRWTGLVLSGGLPQRLPVLRELIVDRFGCPWRMVDAAEETLHGLLRLAQRIVGTTH